LTRSRSLFATLTLALAIPAAVVGCGGEDPEQVLEDAEAATSDLQSGVLDLSFSASLEGDQGGSVDASLSGPFQAEQDGVPLFDLTASVNGEFAGVPAISGEGAVISTGDAGFVEYDGTAYELDQQTFDSIAGVVEQAQAQGSTDDGGFSTEGLSDLKNEGTEDLDGTEVVHISAVGDPAEVSADAASSVQDLSLDFYVGEEDNIVRKVEASASGDAADAGSAAGLPVSGAVDVNFSIAFTEVNEPQTVDAPANPQPFSKLESQLGDLLGGLGSLGALGAAGGSGLGTDTGGGTGFETTPAPPSGGGGSGAGAEDASAYFECIEAAGSDSAALQACEKEL
jgi:hypothetical protein